MEKDLKNNTLSQLEKIVREMDQKTFRAKDIFTFTQTGRATAIDQLSTLPKPFRQTLIQQGFHISNLKTIQCLTDPDGTVKYLFELPDANKIESALLFDNDRKTLCISTQVGCKMDCSFCATAKIKFKRNLTAAEITDQAITASRDFGKISNIVYMGMGEPLDNYDNVIKSLRMLNDPLGLNIGARKITISTCGIPEAIEKLAREDIQFRLAISLHAPKDWMRSKLMPINNAYPLEKLLSAVKKYQQKTKRRVTFEYILIKKFNDSVNNAKAIVGLLKGIKADINLIEYNPHELADYEPSDRKKIAKFSTALNDAGIETHVRYKRGQKIKAACGQLGATWVPEDDS